MTDDDRFIALTVVCPHCRASRGDWCRSPMGVPYRDRNQAPRVHKERIAAAKLTGGHDE